jgi:hypothetical protein
MHPAAKPIKRSGTPVKGARFPVTVHLRPVELLRDVDVVVAPPNIYLELRAWVAANGRPGMPVAEGTVAPTGPGAMADQGIRRIYHAAIATPRPGTNDYDVQPTAIVHAVRAAFAIARAERGRFSPPLGSLCFPLLGAGRGGLAPTTSIDWMWTALEHEVRADNTWDVHFITHRQAIAEVIVERIRGPAGRRSPPAEGARAAVP